MLQQYVDTKNQYPEAILFFRVGDFYESYFEQAHLLHQLLDLAVSDKSKEKDGSIPMAGIPHHALDKYIPRLLSQGYKVAVAEQMTEPMPGKIVERKVTQVITPWTYIQDANKDFLYILALSQQETSVGLNFHIAWGDWTVGEYWTKSFKNLNDVQRRIAIIQPKEIILDVNLTNKDSLMTVLKTATKALISIYEVPDNPEFFLLNLLKIQTLASFWMAMENGRDGGIALLLNYIKHTQTEQIQNVYKIAYHSWENKVLLDDITIKNLEIFNSSYEGGEKYTLYEILDKTRTTAGARYLRYLLLNPTNNIQQLASIHSHIVRYQASNNTAEYLKTLKYSSDIVRLISVILYRKLNPVPFVKLRTSLGLFLDERGWLFEVFQEELALLGLSENDRSQLYDLFKLLDKAIKSNEEIMWDIWYITDWYDEVIDQLRKVAFHSDENLMEYQQFLVKTSGINNIKLKNVLNEGFFVEITQKDAPAFKKSLEQNQALSPEKLTLYHRKTLKDNLRFTTPYLENLANTILSAQGKLQAQEMRVLQDLKEEINQISKSLFNFANILAQLDVFCSHAEFTKEKGYVKPEFVDGGNIEIKNARHWVIEEFLPKEMQFIPNDLVMDDESIHIITWPNMGWKSTYLRQSALIVLLAHCGLFVPADEAKIPLMDWIFARVGSGDIIAKNQSTFMTEMIEVANILNNATKRSFIIFDELGRWTSTYDGIALTKAILVYIANDLKAKTMLATHYHELIAMESQFSQIKNFSVSVYETDKEVVFTKKITKGWANKSYGIDVAQIAWIPDIITVKAREILQGLENKVWNNQEVIQPLFMPLSKKSGTDEKIKSMLASFDLDKTTPLQALQILAKIKEDLI